MSTRPWPRSATTARPSRPFCTAPRNAWAYRRAAASQCPSCSWASACSAGSAPEWRGAVSDIVPQREAEDEGGAVAQLALDREVAAQQARELARDGEPEPRAAARGGAHDLLELVEDPLLVLRGDPRAGVGHAQLHPAVRRPVPRPRAVAVRGRDRHPSLVGELHGVGEEVDQD